MAGEIGYPVLVRPSYVLGGRAMEIVYSEEELLSYMHLATDVSPRHPILVDKYVVGKELEVDLICDGEDCLIPGIMEHIERAGVHSGDSMAVCPPVTLSQEVQEQRGGLRLPAGAGAPDQGADEHPVRAGRRRQVVRAGGEPAGEPHRALSV